MPPKPKFTREQLVDAAFELVREQGVDALVARELAKRLNTTTTPIFTFFTEFVGGFLFSAKKFWL